MAYCNWSRSLGGFWIARSSATGRLVILMRESKGKFAMALGDPVEPSRIIEAKNFSEAKRIACESASREIRLRGVCKKRRASR